jgi:uncharacterized protein YndB with AHSA1/START domain
MPYTFTLTTVMPVSPRDIYAAWLDSLGHSEMTGGEASMSDEVGAQVSAWDGYISGRNLALVPGERIVQSWRTSEFGDALEDSIITVVLQEAGDGTLLTLEHSNVPDDHRSYEEGGWQSKYFEPMVAYFSGRKAKVAAASTEQAVPQSGRRARRKSTGRPPAKKARKAKRAARAKSKRVSPGAKAGPRKSKSKRKARGRAVPATRARAKPSARKSGQRKRK